MYCRLEIQITELIQFYFVFSVLNECEILDEWTFYNERSKVDGMLQAQRTYYIYEYILFYIYFYIFYIKVCTVGSQLVFSEL